MTNLSWSGYTWKVRGVEASGLPGPNRWSDSNASVSNGVLSLTITKAGSVYTCAEVELEQTLGYGRYSFVLDTDVSALDRWPVLGIYTYDAAAGSPFREIDIEAAKFGVADTNDMQFTVQPGTGPQLTRFPATSAPYALEWTWQPGRIAFEARTTSAVLRSFAVTDGVPSSGAEHLFIAAWLYNGTAPDDAAAHTFALSSFTFTPGVTTTAPKIATLHEVFSTTPGDWLATGASISGGNAVIPCGATYARWESAQKYDLRGSSAYIDVAGLPAAGTGTTEAQFFVWHDTNNYVLIEKTGTALLFRTRDSGVNTDNYLAYTGQRFWRIAESAGNVVFATSPDDVIWTTAYTVPHSMAAELATTQIRLACGYYGTETSPGAFTVAAVNPLTQRPFTGTTTRPFAGVTARP